MLSMFNIISSLLKYLFITIIYLFIFGIMKMIYLDIRRIERPRPRNIPKGMPYLSLVNDKNTLYFDIENAYPLDKEVIVLGRGKNCDISIEDLYMSAQHLQLWFDDGEWYVQDMGSKNGTFINGKLIDSETMILDDGDKIKIGQIEFLFLL